MADELNFAYSPGQTLEAGIYAAGWTQQGVNIPLTETGPSSGLYVGSVPGTPTIADGEYIVLFEDAGAGNVLIGRGILYWTSNAEDFLTLDNRLDAAHGPGSWLTADVQAALDAQGYTAARAVLLDFLDAAISSRAEPGDDMGLDAPTLLSIQALILSDATPFDGADIPATLAAVQSLQQIVFGGRDIDFVGSDLLGWQRVERDQVGAELARYNLFDETNTRIDEPVASFIARAGMISAEVPV